MISFINSIRNVLYDKQIVAGCTFYIQQENVSVDLCFLKKENGRVFISGCYTDIGIDKLFTLINPDIPVLCSIAGELVIHKKVKRIASHSLKNYIQASFTQTKTVELIYQYYEIDENEGYISFTRYSHIKNIVDQFNEFGIFVCSLTLGPFALEKMIPHFSNSSELKTIKIKKHLVTIQRNRITELINNDTKEIENVSIGNEKIKNNILLPYVNGLFYFLKDIPLFEIEGNLGIQNDMNQFRFRNLCNKLTIFIPAVWLFVFLVGLSISLFYSSHNEQLSGQYQYQYQKLQEIDDLQKQLKIKQEVFTQLNWKKAKYCSFIADRLAQSIVGGIRLTKLEIFPINGKLLESNIYEFNENAILVQGECLTSEELAIWVRKLNKLSWVLKTKDQNYQWNKTQKIGQFSFIVLINI